MKKILSENKWYFALFGLFLLMAGTLLLNINKGDIILFFSNHRHLELDVFMTYATKLGEEPLYFLIGFTCLFIRFRYSLMVILIGILVTIISFLAKSFFAVDRPYTYFQKLDLLDTLNFIEGISLNKGTTSFPSGHTMSGFALYTLIFLLIKDKNIWILPLLLTAILVSISRVYLVQHFLQDIFLGSILGVMIAVFLYWGHLKYPINKENNWIDKSLLK